MQITLKDGIIDLSVDSNKTVFLLRLKKTIEDHPDWAADAVLAIQTGIDDAVESRDKKIANLAYGFSWTHKLLLEKQRSLLKRNYPYLEKGLKSLAEFFASSSFGVELSTFIAECEAEKCQPNAG